MNKAKAARMTNEERKAKGLPVLGRPVTNTPPEFKVMSNGLYVHQWEWLKEYGMNSVPRKDGAEIQRMAVQWFMDAIAASRNSYVATPEQDEDFERLRLSQQKARKARKSKNQTSHK